MRVSEVDTGPVIDRVHTKYAGIGWFGKNTCIINQKAGSWFFLGEIITNLELKPDTPLPFRVMGRDLVAWRDADGAPCVVVDKCPHRNAKLSSAKRIIAPSPSGAACRVVWQ